MSNLDFEAWRCSHDDHLFCPDEGCPKTGPDGKPYGCARDHGWKPGDPSPRACRGLRDVTETLPDLSALGLETVSPSDPLVTIAGIRQFGLAPDGSDLRDLEAAITRLITALSEARAEQRLVQSACDDISDQLRRAVAREASAREEEREACAKIADPTGKHSTDMPVSIAAAIRSRSNPGNEEGTA